MHADFTHHSKLKELPQILDDTTFEAIYRKFWQRLYDFALAKVHDEDVAGDIVQDLFVALLEKRSERLVANLPSYLFAAVRNRVVDHYKRRLFLNLEEAEEILAPEYPVFLDELEGQFDDALGRLPEKTREIFMLNRLEGRSAGEIAIELKIPQRTVEYHITQALRHLKVFLRTVTVLASLLMTNVIL